MIDAVDVSVDVLDGGIYQFPNVAEGKLRAAVDKSIVDQAALSLVNGESAALVVPWGSVQRIRYVAISAQADSDEEWTTVWERPQ